MTGKNPDKPLFSISTSNKDGDIATGFDASRPLSDREEKIITTALQALPRFLSACLSLMEQREENLRILEKTKNKIGGKWT